MGDKNMNRFFKIIINLAESQYKSKEESILKSYGSHIELVKKASLYDTSDENNTSKRVMVFTSTLNR
jgi:hypothetical protein